MLILGVNFSHIPLLYVIIIKHLPILFVTCSGDHHHYVRVVLVYYLAPGPNKGLICDVILYSSQSNCKKEVQLLWTCQLCHPRRHNAEC